MKSQQEIKRNAQGIIINDLGYTYNQYGQNLLKQLTLNYQKLKLNGKAPNSARKGTQGQSGSNNQNARRI